MKTRFWKSLYGLLLVLSSPSSGATEIDSLRRLIPALPDSEKTFLYGDLCWAFKPVSMDSALYYARKAVAFSTKRSLKRGMAQAYSDLASVYFHLGELDTAAKYYEYSLERWQKLNDTAKIGASYLNLGAVKNDIGDTDRSIEYNFKALKIYESLGNPKIQVLILNNMGNSYRQNIDFVNARKYYEEAVALANRSGDKHSMAMAMGNIALIHAHQEDYQKAIDLNQKAYEIFKETRDQNAMHTALNNLGAYHRKLGDNEKGIAYYRKALEISEQAGDKQGQAKYLNNIGNVYSETGHYTRAAEYHFKALELSASIGAKLYLRDVYESLVQLYRRQGQYEKALDMHRKFIAVKDSLLNIEKSRLIAEMQTKYDTEKKEKQIAELNRNSTVKALELDQERSQKNYLIGAAVLLLILGLWIHARYRYRQVLIMDETKLNSQRLKLNSMIEGEEQERKRIAKDLNNGLGGMLATIRKAMIELEKKASSSSSGKSERFSKTRQLINDAGSELQHITQNMLPDVLISEGLSTSLQKVLDNISSLKTELETQGKPYRLDETIEITMYRVLQEVLNNCLKHSKASWLSVKLIFHQNEFIAEVRDNGVGFDPLALENEGLGLKNIRSRIHFIGGRVQLVSQPEEGTTVILKVPVTPLANET